MSKVQRFKSILSSIIYLPELIAGLIAGILTGLRLLAKNFIAMLPSLCRAIGRFALASFKALITTVAIFAVVNFISGGAPLYPVVILNSLANGTFHKLSFFVQHSFAFIYAASLANFKWNLTNQDFRDGHAHFVEGMLRFWYPPIALVLELVKQIALGLGIFQSDPAHETPSITQVFSAAKQQAFSAAQTIYEGAEHGAAYTTQFKGFVKNTISSIVFRDAANTNELDPQEARSRSPSPVAQQS